MAEAQHAPNHTIDPETGFLENKGYGYAFDAERKKQFINAFVQKGLGLYRTCEHLGISHHTIFNHLRQDNAFKEELEAARAAYAEDLDSISKENARNPKSVIERIFQLKSLFPERYADKRDNSSVNVTISVDAESLKAIAQREKVIDIEQVSPMQQLDSNNKT